MHGGLVSALYLGVSKNRRGLVKPFGSFSLAFSLNHLEAPSAIVLAIAARFHHWFWKRLPDVGVI
jgi:hypothetical protein